MNFIYLAMLIYPLEWMLFYFFTITDLDILLGTKNIIVSLLATALFKWSEKLSLFHRSIIVLLMLTAWCDVIIYYVWMIGYKVDLSIPCALAFFGFLIHTLKRDYPEYLDYPNTENVNILIRKPNGMYEFIKSLAGFPSPSVCILAGGYVWSFRKKSGKYEKFIVTQDWINDHLVINTGVFATKTIIQELENNIGTSRFPFCKCVWTIRNVLNMLGGKYQIKTPFDYIPGIYVLRVLRG